MKKFLTLKKLQVKEAFFWVLMIACMLLLSEAAFSQEKPGPHNTGYSGTLTPATIGTITIDGTVVENVSCGPITVQANNVTIRNCKISGGFYNINCNFGYTGLVIEDCELLLPSSAGIYGGNFTARRLNIHDSYSDAIKASSNVLVENCWIHHLGMGEDAHADGVQTRGSASNMVFRYNNFDMPATIPLPYQHNSPFILQTLGGTIHAIIEYNWVNGGNYSFNLDSNPNAIVRYNKIGRDYNHGVWYNVPNHSCNVWEDTGLPVDGEAPCGPVPVATPSISPASGTYTGSAIVSMSTVTTGASIYYTIDGSTPTEASMLYTQPIIITSSATFKAKAFKADQEASSVQTAAYTIVADTEAPVISSVDNTTVNNQVIVVFNEAVTSASAENIANYSIDNGISINSATLAVDQKSVTLAVSTLSESINYTLTVNNIDDLSNNTIAANSTAIFQYINAQTSSATWQTFAATNQTGVFTAEFDAIPINNNMDGVMGILSGTAAAYTDLSCIVRFYSDGNIDARNGTVYTSDNIIPYSAGTNYHFRLEIDVPNQTYNIYVTPDGGAEQIVGSNYAFRASATSLDSWAIIAASGTHMVGNMTFSSNGSIDPESVTVSPTTLSLEEGQSSDLTETILPSNATNKTVTWLSSNTSIATVDANGTVTGVSEGAATITVTTNIGGHTASCAVSVTTAPEVLPTDITVAPTSLTVNVGECSDLTETVLPANATDKSVSWTSDNTSIATVDANGLVCGVEEGAAAITVTTVNGLTVTCAVTVTNVPPPDGFYCDPVNGSMANDGSQSSPWSSLEDVINAGKTFANGDIIYLMNGNHGFPVITENNTADVTITKAPGQNPVLYRLKFTGGANHWVVKDVEISTNGAQVPVNPPLEHPVYAVYDNTLLTIDGADNITVEDCYINSINDASSWTADDWNYHAWNGLYHQLADGVTIRNCHFKNVCFGMHNANGTSISNTLYEYNTIENYNGDGMRGHGVNTVIQYNVVKNAYQTNGNHCDMIQVVGTTTGLILRGNQFLMYTDPNQPFKSGAQGVGFFDGMYYDFVIENNVIFTDHYNGLTLLGAQNCKIINNTVIDPNDNNLWIQIGAHKDGTPSTGNIVRNNLCSKMSTSSSVGSVDNNVIVPYADRNNYFTNFDVADLSLKAGSPAIDAGSSLDAPTIDINGIARPQGNGIDVGAYEFGGPVVDETNITVLPESISIEAGSTVDLSYTLEPANATTGVTWSTSDPTVATVSNSGVVSALSPGTATITATTSNLGLSDNCVVTVTEPADPYNVAFGKPVTVTAEDAPTPGTNLVDGDISDNARWSADGFPQSATIDLGNDYDLTSIELYTYLSRAYQYTVEASTDGTNYTQIVDRSANITTTQPITNAVSTTARYIKITVTGADGYTGTWVSLNELVVMGKLSSNPLPINNSPTIDPIADMNVLDNAGQQTVNLTGISDGDNNTQTVAVTAASSDINVVDNVSVNYTSGNTIGTLLYTPVAAGTATITVTVTDDGGTANGGIDTKVISFDVTVEGVCAGVTGVSITCPPSDLNVDDTFQSTATVVEACATDKSVTWSSSNVNVITVVDGLFTAIGAGTATITATTNDGGFTADCTVTVNSIPVGKTLPGKIEAEDYDAMSGIQTQSTSDVGGGLNVGWIGAGDWMDYDVYVQTAGQYTISYRIASTSSSAQLQLQKDATILHTVDLPNTGGWQNWSTVEATANLDAGQQTLRIYASASGWNFNWFEGIAPTEILPTGVTLDQTLVSLEEGLNVQLTATVLPVDATDPSVSWSSSDELVATVTDGHVNALTTGTAIITATTVNGLTATCTVNVTEPIIYPTSISLDQTDVSIEEGLNVQLTATVLPVDATDPSVSWSSSDELVATVTDGQVNAIAVGTVIITATTVNGLTATCDVTVVEPAFIDEDFSAGASDFTVIAGGTWAVLGGRYILSSPGNADVGLLGNISVHNTQVNGDFELSTLINITSTTSSWNDIAVVFDYQDINNYCYISLNESNDGNTKGIFKVQNGIATEIADITVAISDNTDYNLEIIKTGADIVVKLDGTQIASATDATFSSGKVGYGSKNDGGQFDDLLVYGASVINPTSVSLDQTAVSLEDGLTAQLTATVLPLDATHPSVSWSSSDELVATVDANGLVTAEGNGTATITVTTNDGGLTATCDVIVTTPVTGVTLSASSLTLEADQTATLTETVSPATASDPSVAWSSSDELVATVVNGLVTAEGEGTATITVTTNDGGYTATCDVTVSIPDPLAQNIVAYLPLDEVNGSITPDNSGNGNDGTVTEASLTSGQINDALNFDGSNDKVSLGNLDVLPSSGNDGITLAAWINPDTWVSGTYKDDRIISKATGTGEQDHYWMLSGIKVMEVAVLRFRLKTGTTTSTLIASAAGEIRLNQWTHVAATYDGSNMKVYVNGTEVGSLAKTGTVATSSSVEATIGISPDGARPFDGQIDEVYVLDRALSQTEISDLMTRGGTAKNLVIGNSAPAQLDINNSEPVFNIYPNPYTGSNLTIEMSNLNSDASTMLQIFDITGKMVYTNQIEADSSSKTMNIQTEGLKKGMYIVSIRNGANTQNMKLIVK